MNTTTDERNMYHLLTGKPILASVTSLAGLFAFILSLINVVSIGLGFGGAILWFLVAYYKFKQGKLDIETSEMDKKLKALQLKNYENKHHSK